MIPAAATAARRWNLHDAEIGIRIELKRSATVEIPDHVKLVEPQRFERPSYSAAELDGNSWPGSNQ
jgi:hypothetical protein